MKKTRAKDVYTLADLREWREIDPPIRLGVIGDPVAHSLSPQMQNAALDSCKIEMQYARFAIRPNELAEALQLMRVHAFVGANLTVPHKIAVMEFLDEVDVNAREVGAANTLKIAGDKIGGFNTDGKGFARAIHHDLGVDVRNLRILLLGAGGAARAIAWQCAREHCERLVIANRTFDKAKALADALRGLFAGPKVLGPVPRLQAVPWEENAFRFQLGHVDLVMNATSLGLGLTDPSPIPARLLEPHLMIYDTLYNKDGATPLLTAAREAGARAADGRSMLLQQGALAFEIWFGRPAPLEVMRAAL